MIQIIPTLLTTIYTLVSVISPVSISPYFPDNYGTKSYYEEVASLQSLGYPETVITSFDYISENGIIDYTPHFTLVDYIGKPSSNYVAFPNSIGFKDKIVSTLKTNFSELKYLYLNNINSFHVEGTPNHLESRYEKVSFFLNAKNRYYIRLTEEYFTGELLSLEIYYPGETALLMLESSLQSIGISLDKNSLQLEEPFPINSSLICEISSKNIDNLYIKLYPRKE